MRTSTAWIVTLIVTGIFAAGFLAPLGWTLAGGFWENGFTLKYLAAVFRNPIYVEGLLNSFKIAIGTTSLVTLISVPLAWLGNRYDFAGKGAFQGLLLVPMILPPFVGAIGFQQMFGQYGSVNALLHLGAVDWIGSTALILSGLLCGMCAGYFWFVSRRIDLRPAVRADAEMAEGAGEIGFFSPGSYWPFGPWPR